jgi:Ser/Thr protein kinase RdoA (MazF antagonist)
VSALAQGYHAVRPLSGAEIEQVPVEAALALRFATTTRITDYSLRAAPGRSPERLSAILAAARRGGVRCAFRAVVRIAPTSAS